MTDAPNAAQAAWAILSARPDATAKPRALEIRRKGFAAGELTDGTRVFIVQPCERWRWLTVRFGWDTIAELDQRAFHERPQDLAAAVIRAIDDRAEAEKGTRAAATLRRILGAGWQAEPIGYREELTAAGPQLVIPGCEKRPPENGKPAQLGLFD